MKYVADILLSTAIAAVLMTMGFFLADPSLVIAWFNHFILG